MKGFRREERMKIDLTQQRQELQQMNEIKGFGT